MSCHVAGGVGGLALGLFAIRPPLDDRFRLGIRRACLTSLVVLAVFLAALVAVDWSPRLDSSQRIIFGALTAFALFILARDILSFRVAQRRPPDWQRKYMNHVYFTYISLWEGLFIVGLGDLNAAPWLIAVVAVGLVVLGATLFRRYQRQVLAGPAPAEAPAGPAASQGGHQRQDRPADQRQSRP
ncbi:MAG TPA: hypothetical protein VIV12_28375 [Streptosporangiaceae bacterium]